MELNNATKLQILQIQGITIIKYVANTLECGIFTEETIDKFQKMFDIVNKK